MYSLSFEFLIAQCSPLLNGALGDDNDKKDDGFVHASFLRVASMVSRENLIIAIIKRKVKLEKMILKSMIKNVWFVFILVFFFIYILTVFDIFL